MDVGSSRSSLILIGVAAALFGGLWLWKERLDEQAPPAGKAAPLAPDGEGSGPRAPGELEREPSAEPADPGPKRGPRWGTPEGRQRRAAMLREIRRRLERGSEEEDDSSTTGAPAAVPRPVAQLGKAYIQEVVREDLLPLARDCYNQLLLDDPEYQGQTVITFTIVGDPEVGGVVESATEDPEQSTLPPQMAECVLESVMSLTFDPPEDGGRVTVTYPFGFTTE